HGSSFDGYVPRLRYCHRRGCNLHPYRHRYFWRTRNARKQTVKAWLSQIFVVCLLAPATTGGAGHGQNVAPPLGIIPSSPDFGEYAVGSESRPVTITISNPGNVPVRLEDVLLSGMDFSEKTDCGSSLA